MCVCMQFNVVFMSVCMYVCVCVKVAAGFVRTGAAPPLLQRQFQAQVGTIHTCIPTYIHSNYTHTNIHTYINT